MSFEQHKKTVLITGASSGFGRLSCQLFQRNGWNVIATMRSPEKELELTALDNVLVVALDVTNKQSIENAIEVSLERFGRIDALVNNAGYGAFGFLEEASEAEARQQMETNFFGVINMIQAVLPTMRKQRSGAIINVTSIGGMIGMPMLSLYSASKFAVEGLTESLSHELKEFGIDVKLVEPGSFATGFGQAHQFNQGNAKPDLDSYRQQYQSFLENILKSPPKPFGLGDPQDVADLIYAIATKPSAKLNHPVGKDAKTLLWVKRLLGKNRVLKMITDSGLPKYQ